MSGHTKGRAEVFRKTSVDSCDSTLVYVWFDVVIDGQIVHDGDGIYNPTNEEEAELKAYSALIAEAFNTYTDTGRTPRQLAAERVELVAALEELLCTGMNGGNNVRLALIAAKQDALSDDELRNAELSEAAVRRARTILDKVKK